ncbi:MAG: SGNH/GDSL hydrolase family protein [archaeon]
MKNSQIRANAISGCTRNLTKIITRDGASNQYYCFPKPSPLFHYKRDTASPFFKFEKFEGNNAVLVTNFTTYSEKIRIVSIGDSIVEGFGVIANETFTYRLEKKLQSAGYDIEILNAAHGGYWMGNYYYLLQEILSKYETDIIIIGVNEHDVYPDWEAIVLNKYLNASYIQENKDVIMDKDSLKEICIAELTPNYFSLNKHNVLSRERLYRSVMVLLEKIRPSGNYFNIVDASRDYRDYIELLQSLGKAKNVTIVWIIFPLKSDDYARSIENDLKARDISYISVREIAPEYIEKGCCILDPPGDRVHPTKVGNAILADILYGELTEKYLIIKPQNSSKTLIS